MTQRTPCPPVSRIARSRPTRVCVLLAAAAVCLTAANQAAETLPQMSLEELLNVKVTVATRTETSLLEAPSIVSVITAEDIRRMGARNLQDVLRTVPGFELGIRNFGYPEIGLRGIITNNSEKIRILLDGVAVNENLEGSGTIVFGDLALENVERIEIIRGPGSAMYGTNAFLGVISILTKEPPASGSATTATLARGSFRTTEGSVRSGWSGPNFRLAGFVHYLDTDGARPKIGRDAISSDPLNGGVSLAGTPDGHADLSERKLTAQVKLDFQDFYFNGVFLDLRKGPYIGPVGVVARHSRAHPYQLNTTLGFLGQPSENWTLEPKLWILHYKADNLWNYYPEGTWIETAPGVHQQYEQGVYFRNGGTQDTFGGELKATWTALRTHKLLGGVSLENAKLSRVINETNSPTTGADDLVNAGPIMLKNPNRTLFSTYLQDQWSVLPDLGITSGIRMDRYSDAGTALSPRLAFVWQATQEMNCKLLYGQAFRAPTFVESYLFAAGGQHRGNADNKAETIRTTELEIGYRFGNHLFWRVGAFQNRIKDRLDMQYISGHYEYRNIPETTVVKGLETEIKFSFGEWVGAFANYSCQSGKNKATGQHIAGMANWRANLGINLSPSERWNLNLLHNMVGSRQRLTGDPRPRLPGYRVTDTTLVVSPIKNLDLTLSAHNLFNQDQRFPDTTQAVPDDFPWEGRSLRLKVEYNF